MRKVFFLLAAIILICFGISWPTTGSISTALNIVTIVSIVLIIVPAIVIAIVLLIKGGKRKVKKVGSSQPGPSTTHHPPASSKHDNTHHESGGDHGHGGSGHHHSKTESIFVSILKLVGVVILIMAALRFVILPIGTYWGFGQKPGASKDFRRSVAESNGTLPSASAVSGAWQRVIAPSDGWSEWIEIPMGHIIRFCDPVKDPSCSAADFSDAEFVPQCRSRVDDSPLDLSDESCRWSTANRIKAKGSEPRTITYRFERA